MASRVYRLRRVFRVMGLNNTFYKELSEDLLPLLARGIAKR